MKVLLTGATGFLGGHLARALVARGDRVVALTRPSSDASKLRRLGEQVEVFNWDPDGEDLPARLEGVRAVVHAATCYGRDGEPDAEVVRANVVFPLRLLEAAFRRDVRTFVNMDTCFNVWPLRYKYLQGYTLSKRHFAEWGQVLSESYQGRFLNLQLQHPYGPGDNPAKFVPFILRECLAGGDVKLTPGEQKKDFIYVDDVVSATLLLLEKAEGLAAGYHPYECGTGQAVSVRQFVETAHRLSGSSARLRFGALAYRQDEIMFSQADTVALRGLGWAPRWGLPQGIAATLSADHGLPVVAHAAAAALPSSV